MKKSGIIILLFWATCFGVQAQKLDKAEIAKQRANRLSDQMIRELKLNNFQAKRLREINQEKVSKMMEIEQKYAHDASIVEKNCQGICRERDKELESFLSFDQYGRYYANRPDFYKYDKDFAKNIGLAKSKKQENTLNKAVTNESLNTSASDPVLRPSVNR
ncbi:hypothetical protein [Adhaeribacter radiodurans]|uniref:DUF4890 domain-containing protein n=1 Tax=Adhaeribacter radiodurans TaxID=2745197 RepID=A0A7L7L9D5_9BACT|nr:hypothetical protein [Adhaeribacter radiodurans]QMU28999.1 hypothetical protein HUW48_13540 [Adhaeribacter radiodurans]